MPERSDPITYRLKYEDCEHENLQLLVGGGVYEWFCPDCGWSKRYLQEERKDAE